jgi:uncharacterized protein (DUF885 family)
MKFRLRVFFPALLAVASVCAAERPRLQILNGTDAPIDIFWLKSDTERVPNGTVAPGESNVVTTTLGHRFAIVGRGEKSERIVTSAVPVQAMRFDPPDPEGIPAFYTQRVKAGGFPIVASAQVNPYALEEAAYLVDQMLARRPDVRAAMIQSGARLSILAWNEFTTDQPEWRWLAKEPVEGFPDIPARDYRDARARGMGGSATDPFCSCAEENLLGYPGDPYAAECILIHEFAHNMHLRGMANVDPTFDTRVKAAYDAAMKAGLWKAAYASVNHHEYFAEGVQNWFDNNRENDHDHNHVNTRAELLAYDPGLAALCREVFGDTEIKYTKPATRLTGHMAGYDPAKAPTFAWPERLQKVKAEIVAQVKARNARAKGEPTPTEQLHALFDAEWEHAMQTSPTWASHLGDRRYNDRWPDLSLAALAREDAHRQDVLQRLAAIGRDALPPAERLNYELFRRNYEESVESFRFGRHLLALDQRSGLQTVDELASALRFETVKDYEDWIARLRGFGTYTEQTIALLREGVRRGLVQPKVTMQRVPAQIAKQRVATPEESPYFKPLKEFAAALGEADRARLMSAAKAAITDVVLPAYQRFDQFFTGEYLPACLDGIGAWRWPDGEATYAFLARSFTTTTLTPREIHDIGLREVARIRGEMEKVRERVAFKGSLTEFFTFLRTDRRFFCDDENQLFLEYLATSKRIDPLLVKLFRTLPRTPYGVERIPAKIAPDTTTAYYRQPAADGSRAGSYFVNTFKPETRPRWEMMALSLHEAVPGHHFQIALAQEQGALPKFRQHTGFTAYVEGWALYAEALGDELGLYADPYDKFGQLTYEMWRAVRLVVDTGIHALRWEREKAIAFFRENAPKSEQDIVNEVDRYISWPGQALAYKIGELKIKELRTRAKERFGEKFDVKEFHDVILLGGAMPLSLLEARVDEWLASPAQP